MDLIVGGGIYGTKCLEHLQACGRSCIVFDTSSKCKAVNSYEIAPLTLDEAVLHLDEGYYHIQGSVPELLSLIKSVKFHDIFPTAPIHVAAVLFKENSGFHVSDSDCRIIAQKIPDEIILKIGDGSCVVSYNPDGNCIFPCSAPRKCPVTGVIRDIPMHRLLQSALPCGHILRSYQIAPGIGALKGDDVRSLLDGRSGFGDTVIIGTACMCHGVVTVLKKPVNGTE